MCCGATQMEQVQPRGIATQSQCTGATSSAITRCKVSSASIAGQCAKNSWRGGCRCLLRRTQHYLILMRFRRKTSGSWTPEKSAKAHAAKARKRMENLPHQTPSRVPAGVPLGVLQWHAADGKVRRWVIRQGKRANGMQVAAQGKKVECGWDHLFRTLRTKLAQPKRLFPDQS